MSEWTQRSAPSDDDPIAMLLGQQDGSIFRSVRLNPVDAHLFGEGPRTIHVLPMLMSGEQNHGRLGLTTRIPHYTTGEWQYFVPRKLDGMDYAVDLKRVGFAYTQVRAIGEIATLPEGTEITRMLGRDGSLVLEPDEVVSTGRIAAISYTKLWEPTKVPTTAHLYPLAIPGETVLPLAA